MRHQTATHLNQSFLALSLRFFPQHFTFVFSDFIFFTRDRCNIWQPRMAAKQLNYEFPSAFGCAWRRIRILSSPITSLERKRVLSWIAPAFQSVLFKRRQCRSPQPDTFDTNPRSCWTSPWILARFGKIGGGGGVVHEGEAERTAGDYAARSLGKSRDQHHKHAWRPNGLRL
jgi:hypothetical protein